MSLHTLIKGGHIIDEAAGLNGIYDLLISGDKIERIDHDIQLPDGATVFEANGLIVTAGFIDLHCHLREPGYEDKETIRTGTQAAAKGGFTTVCAMPNTNPVMDTRATVDYVLQRAKEDAVVRVLPIGSVTKGSKGLEITEMGELATANVVGFSDDGHPVSDSNIMRQALSYSSALNLPIINHCEDPGLFGNGAMNEGWVSNRLGITGIPNSAEDIMVARDISLAQLTGGRYHVAHLSTGGALSLVRDAKGQGLSNITCEVTPHHLTLTDNAVLGKYESQHSFEPLDSSAFDTFAKVNPPLRTHHDREALIEGLKTDVIDFIATDHAPHNQADKLTTFQNAAFGISVLETALGQLMSLVHEERLELPLLIRKLTAAPAAFIGRSDIGILRHGAQADITIFDPKAEWLVDTNTFVSKGRNTPINGKHLRGQVQATFVGGKMIYQLNNNGERPLL